MILPTGGAGLCDTEGAKRQWMFGPQRCATAVDVWLRQGRQMRGARAIAGCGASSQLSSLWASCRPFRMDREMGVS